MSRAFIGVKVGVAIRAGVVGGTVAAGALGAAARVLQPGVLPWWSSVPAANLPARALDWIWTAAVLLPIGIALGLCAAFACALVFEYVTRRAGWRAGGLVGLCVGLVAAAVLGLLPWLAWQLGYTYTPPRAPLGPGDPSWVLASIAGAASVAGAIAGAWYGAPLHASVRPPSPRWRQIYPTSGAPM